MTFLVSILLKMIVVSAIIIAVTTLVRHQSAIKQSTAIHLGLVALLITPVLAGAFHFSGIGLAISTQPRVQEAAKSRQIAANLPQPSPVTPHVAHLNVERQHVSSGIASETLSVAIFLIWFIPAVVLLLRLIRAHYKIHSLLTNAVEINDREVLRTLSELVDRTHFRRPLRLFVSSAVDSPLSIGLTRAAIVLDPKTLHQRTGLESILAHELAHIAARDSLRLCVSNLATAINWFNPLVWALDRRASFLREAAADERVVAKLQRPIEYAIVLTEHVRSRMLIPFQAAHAMAPRKAEFKARIDRILNYRASRSDSRSLTCGALIIGVVAFFLVAAYGQVDHKKETALSTIQANNSTTASHSNSAPIAHNALKAPYAAWIQQAIASDDNSKDLTTSGRGHVVAEGTAQASDSASVKPYQQPAIDDDYPVHKSGTGNLAATLAFAEINGAGLRLSSRQKRFAERAQEIFPRLADLTVMEMSILSGAASIEDLRALYDYGFKSLTFHEILPATSIGVRSRFLEVAVRNGCTQHTLDELIRIAAIESVPGEVSASKRVCDVPATAKADVQVRPFNY